MRLSAYPIRCPGPPCRVKKYRGSRCSIEEIRNVPKKLLDAAVAIEEPNRSPYPAAPWPYPSREFRAWLIPVPAADRRNREGATLSPAKSSNFCLVLSGPGLVAISGKKIERFSRTAMVVLMRFWRCCGALGGLCAGASGRSRRFGSCCAAAVAATPTSSATSRRADEQGRIHSS
jgi:hypothetical protein